MVQCNPSPGIVERGTGARQIEAGEALHSQLEPGAPLHRPIIEASTHPIDAETDSSSAGTAVGSSSGLGSLALELDGEIASQELVVDSEPMTTASSVHDSIEREVSLESTTGVDSGADGTVISSLSGSRLSSSGSDTSRDESAQELEQGPSDGQAVEMQSNAAASETFARIEYPAPVPDQLSRHMQAASREYVPLPPDIVRPRTTVEHLPALDVVEPDEYGRIDEPGVPLEVLSKKTRKLTFNEAKHEAALLRLQRRAAANGQAKDSNDLELSELSVGGGDQGYKESDDVPFSNMPSAPSPARAADDKEFTPNAEGLEMTSAKTNMQDDEKACEVCQNAYTGNDEVLLLPCSHYFHTECISRWLGQTVTCPVCREELVKTTSFGRNVQIRRTTTVHWMPVLHWVPVSSTSVTIRAESTNDGQVLETVTTATTRSDNSDFWQGLTREQVEGFMNGHPHLLSSAQENVIRSAPGDRMQEHLQDNNIEVQEGGEQLQMPWMMHAPSVQAEASGQDRATSSEGGDAGGMAGSA